MKSVQIRSFFWSVVSHIRNARKYGSEKTPYLDTFHAVSILLLTETLISGAGSSNSRWNKGEIWKSIITGYDYFSVDTRRRFNMDTTSHDIVQRWNDVVCRRGWDPKIVIRDTKSVYEISETVHSSNEVVSQNV